MLQLSILNKRFRKDENNPSSFMQASFSNLCIALRVKGGKTSMVRNQSSKYYLVQESGSYILGKELKMKMIPRSLKN